jgi:DNA-binding NarL/FixJ family response regulator
MKRILIVEDHSLFRGGMAVLIEWRTGLGSIQAGSLAEARRVLRDTNHKPVCAIVDLDLPDGGGVELVEQLRELPVIALTLRSLDGHSKALEAGADEVLSPAVAAEEIVSTVQRLMHG